MRKVILCTLTVLFLVSGTVASAIEADDETNYMSLMMDAAVSGDMEVGQEAARLRDEKIDRLEMDYVKVRFDDLFLLAKIMQLEAGVCAHDECPLGVGEVVLNRVDSPEWDMPDTIEEVLKAPGQYYYPGNSEKFDNALPDKRCAKLALKLLEGERRMEPCVIFQDNRKHGSGEYTSYKHDGHARLYFSKSSYLWLY